MLVICFSHRQWPLASSLNRWRA